MKSLLASGILETDSQKEQEADSDSETDEELTEEAQLERLRKKPAKLRK